MAETTLSCSPVSGNWSLQYWTDNPENAIILPFQVIWFDINTSLKLLDRIQGKHTMSLPKSCIGLLLLAITILFLTQTGFTPLKEANSVDKPNTQGIYCLSRNPYVLWLPSDIHRGWYSMCLLDFPPSSTGILPGPTLCFDRSGRTPLS